MTSLATTGTEQPAEGGTGRYWLVALTALVICGASIVALDWGLYHLMLTGSCASGGPYVSAKPCPPGTAAHILAVIGAVFAGLIGVGIWAARGRRGQRRESRYSLALTMWSLLFCTIAGAGLYATLGPAAQPDASKGTAIFLAAIFIPMGIAPLPLMLWARGKGAQAAELVQHGSQCRGTVVSVEDTGVTINDNPRVKITVRAEPDNETPFTIEKASVVSRVNIPRPGDRVTVYYDPSDPEHKNGISFDPAAKPAPAPAEPESATAEGDPLAKIEKLGELRAKGLITEAEFEEQKAKLLGEV